MAHTFHHTDPHVIIVGQLVDGKWHYLASAPMSMAAAEQAVKDWPGRGSTTEVAFVRAEADPSWRSMV